MGLIFVLHFFCSLLQAQFDRQRLATQPVAVGGARTTPAAMIIKVCVLQCVAVCCSVLQCVAVCRSVLQCVAVCCSVLLCVAVCCSV